MAGSGPISVNGLAFFYQRLAFMSESLNAFLNQYISEWIFLNHITKWLKSLI